MNIPLAPRRGQQGLTLVLLLSVLMVLSVTLIPHPENTPVVRALVLLLAAGLAWVMWAAPRRLAYQLAERELVISRLLGQTRLPYAGMQAWRTAGKLGLRVGGTALPAYHTGHYTFSADGLKTVRAASSNISGGVIVQVDGKAYFLTPADPDAFLHELAQQGANIKE